MRLPDAIVYVLCRAARGMTTDQIAAVINEERLHVRLDGNPVSSKQVYAVICRHPATFVKDAGLIRLIM
ncbi:MAG: hypothetical protein K2G53_09345 [Muribaculaceae bacterium]|nr:hypothetical protein [Bacteroides sp.]MBD5303770.1 hypothetical protein [Bacteroides sp.]MDE6072737.1 hypothetical protein [Muribaculaceae bacterium]